MKRTTLISIVLALFVFAFAACKKDEPKEEPKPAAETETPEAEAEEKEEEKAEEKVEEKEEKAEEKAEGDEKMAEGEEKAEEMAPAEPGKIPFDYPTVATTAKAGEFVLAPPREWIDKGFEKGGDKTTFIYYTAEMVEPGEIESKLKKIGKDEMVPNSMIIAIPKGGKAKKGDVVLTWWQSGSGMKRGYVVSGTETEPVIRYLDADLDNPSGLGTKEEKLKPDSFVVLSNSMEPGTTVAIKNGSNYNHGQVVNVAGDKVLTVGFAGRVSVSNTSDIVALPVKPSVKKGDSVWIPYIGSYRSATVEKIDNAIGRVHVKFEFAGKEKEYAVAFGDVAPSLSGEVPVEVAKVDTKKPEVGPSGVFKGNVTGTTGVKGDIMLSLKGDSFTGNLKGTRDGSEKFVTGLKGSVKGKAFNGNGSNKNTSLTLTGKVINAKKLMGQLNGDVNGKAAKMTFTAEQ